MTLAACGFGPLAAVGAGLGWLSRSRLRSLAHHAQGLRWANVAIAVGVINSTLWLAAWTWITLEPPGRDASSDDDPLSLPFATQPMVATPRFKDYPELETLPILANDSPRQDSTSSKHLGQISVSDVGESVGSLSITLEEQSYLAYSKGRIPVLWLVAPDCRRCERVAQALRQARLQRALAHTILIRVNASQFGAELQDLQLPVRDLPGFALLSHDGSPIDFLHAGEWDDDSAQQMAPVLETFVEHQPNHRRFPWRGGVRSDETPI
ncbi:MAG TPA: hypothetical protein VG963_32665 [Polyangiaceae bacterium]|nr:hypothetical protein [Polyangiaceae bacterium]